MRVVGALAAIACVSCGARSMLLLGDTDVADAAANTGEDGSPPVDAWVPKEAAAPADGATSEEHTEPSFDASACAAPVGEATYLGCAWSCCGFHLSWTCGDTYAFGAGCPPQHDGGLLTYAGTCSVNGQVVGKFAVTTSICACSSELAPVINAAAQQCGFRP